MRGRWFAVVGLVSCALPAGCQAKRGTDPCICAESAAAPTAGPSATPTSPTGVAAIPWDFPSANDLPPALPTAVDLPAGATAEVIHAIVVVDLSKDGSVAVDGRPVSGAEELTRIATVAHQRDPGARAVIRADRSVSWGTVVGILDRLRQASFAKIAFAVDALAAP